MLDKYQCRIRARPAGILVIVAVDDQAQPCIALSEDVVFRFHLHLQNADFAKAFISPSSLLVGAVTAAIQQVYDAHSERMRAGRPAHVQYGGSS